MMEKVGKDFANLIRSMHPEKEIDVIMDNIDNMMDGLDDFEGLLTNMKDEAVTIMENYVATLKVFKSEFEILQERIDKLERFVNTVNANVDAMERTVDIAEEELNVPDYSLKRLILKPLLNKTIEEDVPKSNLQGGVYHEIPIFETSQYFKMKTETQEGIPSGVQQQLNAEHSSLPACRLLDYLPDIEDPDRKL